jgi:hypothetical protein
MNLFDIIEYAELAGAIARQSNHIDKLKTRRDSLIQFEGAPREPWAYRPATNIVRYMRERLDHEIREEKRVLRDMRRSHRTRQLA